ncbi:MAG: 50S ribosomal protein L29 [Methylobacter sp.]|nr:MAG: 50S ribosomal protein L29 [Methylobacter sp.]PPD23773.1 MAG: 50S ribosomal protein L29 [Methylobacter sp.]PPD34383.1 MAG: 50S ribosomal protein L29 [Methylomonas sp.]
MKITELRNKSKDELKQTLLEISREQFNLRMQKGTGQLSKPDLVKKARRNVAKIKTVLTEIEMADKKS